MSCPDTLSTAKTLEPGCGLPDCDDRWVKHFSIVLIVIQGQSDGAVIII